MDHERVSRELIRALRDHRSQPWLSRRIGLRSNLVYRWEAGRAWPAARQVFRIARAVGIHAEAGLARLLGRPADAVPLDLESRAGVAQVLRALAGPRSISEVGELVGKSRYVVSRWLSGHTEIRLPDLLRFVDATTLRGLEFLALLVDPSRLGSVAKAWKRLEGARRLAYDAPWSHAVLRALEVAEATPEARVDDAWIGQRLGIPPSEVRVALTELARYGQIRAVRGRLRNVAEQVVETGVDPERRRALAAFWSRVANDRLGAGTQGVQSFNLFTLAEADLPRLRALYSEFFNALRALVSESSPAERILLFSAQLVPLDR
jgi:transcriptional regulator with XRE-family HTH domain